MNVELDTLGCGAGIDDLLDQVAAGRTAPDDLDAHQAGCPHCQAALGEYARLWAPVRELAATEVRAPESLLDDALRRIRGAVTDTTYGTLPSPTGTTRVSARVVVVTARQTAQDIAGVRVALSRLTTTIPGHVELLDPTGAPTAGPARPDAGPDPAVRVEAGVAGASTAVEITLAADYGTDLTALAERIRTEVTHRVRDLTGLEPVTVNIRIDDVFT